MSTVYKIWDKQETIYTPSGEEFTPEQWMDRYKWAKSPEHVMVVFKNGYNGGFSERLDVLKFTCEQRGATFAEGLTDQELLDAIEQFENDFAAAQQAAAEEAAAKEAEYAAASLKADQTVAGAFAYQNMMNY